LEGGKKTRRVKVPSSHSTTEKIGKPLPQKKKKASLCKKKKLAPKKGPHIMIERHWERNTYPGGGRGRRQVEKERKRLMSERRLRGNV